MARADVIVLGAGIVGVSTALNLVKRGLAVALVDRRGPGEETSYGNAGIIEGDTIFPPAFPHDLATMVRVALGRAPEANYHLAFLPRVASFLLAYRAWSSRQRLIETARLMRPLFARAIPEHAALMAESGLEGGLRRTGWLKLYRTEAGFEANALERKVAESYGVAHRVLDADGARALEPSLAPVFRHAVFWETVASVADPLALTQAYTQRFAALGGRFVRGDAMTLGRGGQVCGVDTAEGRIEAGHAVLALGPWTGDLLSRFGVRLPLAVKRGYHRHYRPRGQAALARPVLDAEGGYVLAPMAQGIRLTTGVEFADRDAPPTPVQLNQVFPTAKRLFPLGAAVEEVPWMGSRPTLPDSRPVIGQAPGCPWLWIAAGHAHWGLTLGPATGRLVAEMMTGATPFCDPAPYRAERFGAVAA